MRGKKIEAEEEEEEDVSCEEIDPICVGSVGDVEYVGHSNVVPYYLMSSERTVEE